jgi:predicted kinase
MTGVSGPQRVPPNAGIYSRSMTEKTYENMAREAEKSLIAGGGVILDATFSRRAQREIIVALARKQNVPVFLVQCSVSAGLTKSRLQKRAAEGKDVSDGRWEIYVQQRRAYEPVEELPAGDILELNTNASPAELARLVETFLERKMTPRLQ